MNGGETERGAPSLFLTTGGSARTSQINRHQMGVLCQSIPAVVGRTRGSTLLVRVENVVLRLHFHMARVSAI